MKIATFITGAALALAIFLFAQKRTVPVEQLVLTHVVDLTHTISAKSPAYELSEKFVTRQVATFQKDGYAAREIAMPEHFGTHVDAPSHMAQNRWTVDEIPAERLVRPLVVMDVREKVKDPDYLVSVQDIAEWEKEHGRIPPGAFVAVRTGWDERWNSAARYRNPDAKQVMHFPGYSVDAAKFLAEAREVVGLGIDTLSVDYGPSHDFPVHHYTAARDLYHVENLANLGIVPPLGAIVVIGPAKFEGGTGAPARVLALLK